jgi:hypothetical protein
MHSLPLTSSKVYSRKMLEGRIDLEGAKHLSAIAIGEGRGAAHLPAAHPERRAELWEFGMSLVLVVGSYIGINLTLNYVYLQKKFRKKAIFRCCLTSDFKNIIILIWIGL